MIARIEADGWHFDCGIYGVLFIPEVLSKYSKADIVLRVLRNMEYPGYGWWIAKGATTLCEYWDMHMSHNHQMFCAIDQWFYRYAAGIRYELSEGVPVLILEPKKLEGLTSVSAHTRDVSIEISDGECRIRLTRDAILLTGGTRTLKPGEYQIQMDKEHD